MNSDNNPRTPIWVWGLILLLALLQPAALLSIQYAPPKGATPTGLHIADSALFLQSMRMFETGFHSPYATNDSPWGEQSFRYFAVPHLWLYGVLGAAVRLLHLDPFLAYGFASGLGAFFLLWVMYRFFLTLIPRYAHQAFLLFSLSGGVGGILFLLTGLLDLHGHPDFERYFTRFALYELMEGPHLNPALYYARLYYTLSLGCCFGAFTAFYRAVHHEKLCGQYLWAIPLAVGAFVDARYAVFTGGMVLLVCAQTPSRKSLKALLLFALPALLGALPAWALLHTNPASVENHLRVGNMAMWLSPFLAVTVIHLLLAARPLWKLIRAMNPLMRLTALASLGYLLAYAVLYLLYQGYYGNLLTGRDASVAAAISDWALLGAGAGLGFACFWRPQPTAKKDHAWVALCFLTFLALSLSGFGKGWFLQFGPQRIQVFLWPPLCLLAATGLPLLPNWGRRCAWTLLLGGGVTAILVSTFAFQAPCGRQHAQGPYALSHTEIMTHADANTMAQLGEGRVLAPIPAADIIALNLSNPVVFGIASFNLTERPFLELKEEVEIFFHPEATEATRRSLAQRNGAKIVYCADTWPVQQSVLQALEGYDWLDCVYAQGKARVFRLR